MESVTIDCTGWNYSFFCEQLRQWQAAGFGVNYGNSTATIYTSKKEVLAAFPNLERRIVEKGDVSFKEEMRAALKTEISNYKK